MGALHLALLAAALQVPQDTIRSSYANPATRILVGRAMERHRAQDSAVTDYRARIRYRLSVAMGRRRWASAATAAVEEQEALVAWQAPNDLRIDILGRRFRSRSSSLQLSSRQSHPWFVPRGLGDSVRIFDDGDLPAGTALHPLGRGAEAAYHFDLLDSLSVVVPGSGELKLYSVQVIPRVVAPALVAGRLWLDAQTAEVVRFSFRYVGTQLWATPESEEGDSAAARRINRLVNRFVTLDADLEYSLRDGRHWMPYRQSITGTVRIPVVGDMVIPFQAVTTFDDYEISTGTPVAFTLAPADSVVVDTAAADSALVLAGRWPGGRYELHRPGDDSLARYRGWTDSLRFDVSTEDTRRMVEAQAELARIAEELPEILTGRSTSGIGYETLADAVQYNRVQGISLGAGYRVRIPGTSFTDLYGTIRYGFSDERVTARASVVRDAPAGRVALSVYRDIMDTDPFSPGRSLANSANALFTAHDYADYHLATGASLGFVTSVGLALDLSGTVRGERQRSVAREARSSVNDWLGGDGFFPDNRAVAEGDFGSAALQLTRFGTPRWSLAVEGMAGEGSVHGRAMADVRYGRGGARGWTLRLRGGIADADAPPQLQFRLGGMQTVRGFEYASLIGPAFWAAQLDVSPLRGTIRPVLFLDAGQAGRASELFGSEALVGGGIGVSVYSPLLRTTLVRLDLSHPVTPDTGGEWRFDLVFSPVR